MPVLRRRGTPRDCGQALGGQFRAEIVSAMRPGKATIMRSTGSLSSLAALLFPERLTLKWWRYGDGSWCGLSSLNLADPQLEGKEGVYVLWRSIDRRVVRVGPG